MSAPDFPGSEAADSAAMSDGPRRPEAFASEPKRAGLPVSAELSATEVEALQRAVDEWSRPKSSAEFGGDLVRDFLAPTVAALVAQAASERERALREKVEAVVCTPQADLFRDEAWRHVVQQPFADNRYLRLLDDVRAALSPEAAS